MEMARLLRLVERQFTQRIATELESAGATVEQWRALNLLADGVGHPMSQVAEHVLLAAPTTTKLVDGLVAQALVYRRIDDTDRRRVLIFLSARGRTALRRWNAAAARAHTTLESEAGSDDLTQLAELLTRLSARI